MQEKGLIWLLIAQYSPSKRDYCTIYLNLSAKPFCVHPDFLPILGYSDP